MTKKAKAIHLVCRERKNVRDESSVAFSTGFWYLARKHLQPGLLVALHERKADPSYLQGHLDSFTPEKARVVLHVNKTSDPVSWQGNGSGEKGYAYEADPQL